MEVRTYSEILRERAMTGQGSFLICGYPFDRSTAVLAAELKTIENAYIIDLIGDMRNQQIGEDILVEFHELPAYAWGWGDNRKILVDLSGIPEEEQEAALTYALSYAAQINIYIIGMRCLSPDLTKLFSKFMQATGIEIVCSVDQMNAIINPEDARELKYAFPEMILAGRENIQKYTSAYVGQPVYIDHNAGMEFELIEGKRKKKDLLPGVPDSPDITVILDFDVLISDPAAVIRYGKRKIAIPSAYLFFLTKLAEEDSLAGRRADKVLTILMSIMAQDSITQKDRRIVTEDGLNVWNASLWKCDKKAWVECYIGHGFGIYQALSSLSSGVPCIIVSNDPKLKEKAGGNLQAAFIYPYPYMITPFPYRQGNKHREI